MSWLSFGLLLAVAIIAAAEARAVPKDEPLAFMLGPNGAPMLMMRAKRQPAYPHRAMMFTGYYRPTRSDAGQATGVFAQGNAVSGGSYVDNPTYLESGPEPAEDAEVASSEAEAAPQPGFQDEQTYSAAGNDEPQQAQPQQDELQPYGTETPLNDVSETAADPEPTPAKRPSKSHKTKKTSVQVNQDDEADDEEEDEESDDEQSAPFVPFKANRRGQMPNLNNFFPMVFSFPGSYGRKSGSSSGASPPGMITAIANSYSTGKSGIASSVATAYGGSPNGKKKQSKSVEE